ncbi:LysR substrate-binding domain-containing protein [Paraburkholderia sp. CNPSo 3272]|uniref:LysR substrate-binding domain-containing protein n=1 Tax=Paraburkholderia sp. CNPSo 3272 TaxID=2940931 RepID=UPI0020B83B95|nr:LysR substrate-binding domain-containing protein [Paraburkholderia sp. CNPSo 3272]MCP3724313.1 LysR substrate-binding domain-containing protein [Paraburkholderia sp. CNPSo 3272]
MKFIDVDQRLKHCRSYGPEAPDNRSRNSSRSKRKRATASLAGACVRTKHEYGAIAAAQVLRAAQAPAGALIARSAGVGHPPRIAGAAVGGQGVALLPKWLVAPDVAAGRLVRLFEDSEITADSGEAFVYATYLPNRRLSRKVRAFIRFVERLSI